MMPWQGTATAVLGASLALGLGCDGLRLPPPSLRAELTSALGSCRPLEGRVAGLAYAPFPYCATPKQATRRQIARIRRRIGGQTGDGASSATLSAEALLQIVARNWEAAAGQLRAASARSAPARPGGNLRASTASAAGAERARLESDLAAVGLAKASRDDDPYELTLALAAAYRAVSLDPRLPEARFNFALVEERLFLVSHASAAWRRYLVLDHTSPWAAEADRHLRQLAPLLSEDWQTELPAVDAAASRRDSRDLAPLVARFRQKTRMYAERDLFADWARSADRGDADRAASAMRRLTAIARALRDQTGDRQLDEAASLAERAAGDRRQALIAGHVAYARALDLSAAGRFQAAERSIRTARRQLARAGSPFELWATLQQALVAYFQKRQQEALRSARIVAASARDLSYSALAGRANWLAGLILLERSEATAALEPLHLALANFERNGEVGNQASISSLLAIDAEYLGAPREAWKLRLRALRDVVLAGDHERATVLFGSAAQSLARQGMPEIGLLFADEVLDRDLASGEPLAVAEAFWTRGLIHHQAHTDGQAAADLREASRYCARIEALAIRRHTEAVIAAVQGAVQREADPAIAMRSLSRALRLFTSEQVPFLKVEVLLDRALAFLSLGDLRRAEADLAAGIEEYERQRLQMRGAIPRISFFDRAERIFDVMIHFQLDLRRRPDLAFSYAERAQARALLDSLSLASECGAARKPCKPEKTFDAASVMGALPASMALVEIHLMEDRVLTWVLCRHHLAAVAFPTGAARVAKLAADLASAARTENSAAFETTASELYDLLIAPIAGSLPPDSGLVFVSDRELQRVPLAALRNRRTGRFLFQEHPLVVAASASTYCLGLMHREPDALHQRVPFTALTVGNPDVDRARFPELRALPAAAREAKRMARVYPGSVVELGRAATVASFLAEIDRHDLVQFAGHAVSDPAQRARLLFAADGEGPRSGELGIDTIAGLRLHHPRLVILSACAAGSGPAAHLEGTSSLARAFLTAGAPAVLANLWNVDDEVAAAFSERFHAWFRLSPDALAALQHAQAAMLTSPDPRWRSPAAWAGFQLYGAAAWAGKSGEAAGARLGTALPRPPLSARSPPT